MVEINNSTRTKLPITKVKKAAEGFLKMKKLGKKEVSIAFVGEKKMRDLNKIYRNKDYVTDVLSFDGEGSYLGEVIINWQQIKRQAKKLGKKNEDELIFILIHGLLHLIGYDDKSEKDKEGMIELGEEIIKKLKI